MLQGSIFIHVSVSGFSCAENEKNKADSNLKYMFIMVASRAKVAPFALCLLGGSAPQAHFTRSCDLWLWCLVVPDLVQHHGIKMKEASMPVNGENQFRHGGIVIVLYDLLCGDIDLFAECLG